MTPEGKVKAKLKAWYAANLPDHWRVSPRGGPFGKAGCPDDIICYKGVFIAIEVKSDVGDLSAVQLLHLKLIQKAGGISAVIRGYDVERLKRIKALAEERAAVLHRDD